MNDTVQSEPTRWLSCYEANAVMEPAHGESGFDVIRGRASLGRVRSRAEIREETRFRRGAGNITKVYENDLIPAWVWGTPTHPSQGMISIIAGDFNGEALDQGEAVQVRLIGIEFAAEDIERMAGKPSNIPAMRSIPAAQTKDNGGKPRESEKWDAVMIALARLACEGHLDRGLDIRFKTQADLRRAILDDPGVAALDVKEDTIKPSMGKVWHALLGEL